MYKHKQWNLPFLYMHSFIPDIYIAPLQETYSEALSVQLRSKRNVLRSLQKEDTLFNTKHCDGWSLFQSPQVYTYDRASIAQIALRADCSNQSATKPLIRISSNSTQLSSDYSRWLSRMTAHSFQSHELETLHGCVLWTSPQYYENYHYWMWGKVWTDFLKRISGGISGGDRWNRSFWSRRVYFYRISDSKERQK